MSTSANNVNTSLPREMEEHTYPILYALEGEHWWFVGRRKIIAGFIEEICRKLGKRRPRILDVGCGTGANLQMLSEYGVAEGLDISPDALEFCRARGLSRVKQGMVESLPYEDASFDLITGLDVVEHLDDDVAGLKEIRRVLRPGGRAFFFVPAFMFLWGVQDDISNHRRRYTLSELKQRLIEAGLSVERASYANITFFFPTLIGRLIMRATGLRPASESHINIAALNGFFGWVLGLESYWLRHFNLPFGVSIVCVARKD